MSSILLLAQQAVEDVYNLLLSELEASKRDQLTIDIFNVSTSPRWPFINNEDSLDEIWKTIRENEPLTDFVIRGTSLFILKVGHHDTEYSRLIDQCATSVSWVAETTIIDEAITERCGNKTWFGAVFKQAHWLLFLFILSTIRQIK